MPTYLLSPPPLSWFGDILATVAVFMVCLGGLFYWRPLWVIDQSLRAWLRLAGARSEYVQLDSFRMHYFIGGEGPPLVLLHGLAGRAENWFGLIPSLMRRGHRVYAIDLLGFGRSDRPDVDYSIALQAEILNQFFDSQNLTRADVGGWSMGGWVALKFALAHPERVRRIFVADSAGVDFELAFEADLFRPTTVDQAQHLLVLLTPQGGRIPRFVARDIVRRVRPMRWVVERAMRSMVARNDLLDGQLCAIRVPVLIIWGKQDALLPLTCGKEMHRQMPHSLLAIFDGCGHLAPAERSGRISPEILHFLEAEPPLPTSVREFAR